MTKKSKIVYIIGAVIVAVFIAVIGFLVVAASGLTGGGEKVIFSSGSAEKIYDGKPLSNATWQLAGGKLQDGHTAKATNNTVRVGAGTSPNHFTVKIVDQRGADVSDDYSIEYRPGELKVLPLGIIVESGAASKEYDGTELKCDTYEVTGETLAADTLNVSDFNEKIEAGVFENTFTAAVTDSEGKDVTQNYAIEKIYGVLSISRRAVRIATLSYHSVYDGNPVTYHEWRYVSENEVLPNHDITVNFSGTQTDAGLVKNTVKSIAVTEDGTDVGRNYLIEVNEGDLIVTRRTLTIRSESDIKAFDGTPLTNDFWEIVSLTKPVEGHTVKVAVSGSQLAAGQSDNFIAEVLVLADGTDVTYNYDIIPQEGVLTVTDGSSPQSSNSGGLDESGEINSGLDGDESDVVLARVYSAVTGEIYLRFMSFGDYSGTKWDKAAEYPYVLDGKYGMNYLTGIALKNSGYESYRFSVESLTANYALPYYLDTDMLSYEIQRSDVKYSGNTAQSYSGYYFPGLAGGFNATLPIEYADYEKAYHEFVAEQYADIPSSTRTLFNRIISDNGFNKNNPGIISIVANFIKNSAVYNKNYNRDLDSESDIVARFLDTYAEGTCTHFASAATLLYRALGIPARYTAGYAGGTVAGRWVDFTAGNAHAWVEVYVRGTGWVRVEVTPLDGGENETSGNENALKIKPVDLYMQYYNGAVLNAQNKIQGLTDLLAKGYSYEVRVAGRQTAIGIGYSTVVAFALFDASLKDVTAEFDFIFLPGKLQLYVKELTISTRSLSKVYDGKPLFSNQDDFEIEGELIGGHSFKELAATGSQTDVGSSQNTCGVKIVKGAEDVSYMYKINNDYGTLTVEPRQITVTAGSITKTYDGAALSYNKYDITSALAQALADGHTAVVAISGSQTAIGESTNEITSVVITDKKGKDVTGNYSIEYVNGRLFVTR